MSAKLEESTIFLKWYPDSKDQPRRKVKRHIKSENNKYQRHRPLIFRNTEQTHTKKQTKAVTKTQSRQKCKKYLHLYMCKSNYIHEINEVFTGIKISVFPLSGVFTPQNVHVSKESFLSFNKLDNFPSCHFFFKEFRITLWGWRWGGAGSQISLRKKIYKNLQTRQGVPRTQKDTDPDSGFLSLWKPSVKNGFRIPFPLAVAEPPKAPSSYSERHPSPPGRLGTIPFHTAQMATPSPVSSRGSWTRPGPSFWRPGSCCTFGVAASVPDALDTWSVVVPPEQQPPPAECCLLPATTGGGGVGRATEIFKCGKQSALLDCLTGVLTERSGEAERP